MTDHGIPLTRVYEKTSAKGNRYFVGRLGNARLLMFQDTQAEGDDPVWSVFLAEVAPSSKKPPVDASEASGGARTRQRRRNASAAPKTTAYDGDWQRPFDDPVPL